MLATKLLPAKPAWSDREHVIRTLHVSKEGEAGALVALETYGAEIYAFLSAAAHTALQSEAAFSELCHDVWQSFRAFRWGASLRTWMYVLAYESLLRVEQGVELERPRACTEVAALLARAREAAPRWQYAGLRHRLDREDRALLVLKVDRNLSWRDVVEVLDLDELTMRMRLDRIKKRVRDLAREENVSAQASFARLEKRSIIPSAAPRPDGRAIIPSAAPRPDGIGALRARTLSRRPGVRSA